MEIVAFGIYGIVYLLGIANAISPMMEQALYTFGDAAVKLLHSSALFATHRFEASQIVSGLVDDLTLAAQNLTHLFETANAPIFEVDPSLRVTRWNGYMAKLTSRTFESMRQKRLLEEIVLCDSGDKERIESLLRAGLKGEASEVW